MSKRLVERALDRLKEHSKKSYSHNKAIFLSLSDEIREALGAGLSLKAIWETLYEEGRIGFKYDTFLRYSRQYLVELEKEKSSNQIKNGVTRPVKKKSVNKPRDAAANKEKESTSAIPTFEYNPEPNMDDFT